MLAAQSSSRGKAAAAAAAVIALTACSGSSEAEPRGPIAPSSNTAAPIRASEEPTSVNSQASPSPGTTGEAGAVLAQYRAFFSEITPVWGLSDASARAARLKQVAVDPEYTTLLSAMKATRDIGEVGYGADVVRPELKSLVGNQATLVDCQDTSQAGRQKLDSGAKVTQGRKNDLAQVTMMRGLDEVWRVATVAYAAAGSCHADG